MREPGSSAPSAQGCPRGSKQGPFPILFASSMQCEKRLPGAPLLLGLFRCADGNPAQLGGIAVVPRSLHGPFLFCALYPTITTTNQPATPTVERSHVEEQPPQRGRNPTAPSLPCPLSARDAAMEQCTAKSQRPLTTKHHLYGRCYAHTHN